MTAACVCVYVCMSVCVHVYVREQLTIMTLIIGATQELRSQYLCHPYV